MKTAITEELHDAAMGLDELPPHRIASILVEAQICAATAVRLALPMICDGATAMAQTIRSGGTLHYVAAGSSGLMAAADAQELGGTFSIPSAQLMIHMAGGLPTGVDMPGDTEDAADGFGLLFERMTPQDTVIAVSASGTTPYTVAAVEVARTKGAAIIGVANNPDAKLLELADHPILLETPPEVLSGSTRMGAGTAQKIALNMLSTLMATQLGHVHDGMMVNLHVDNQKLRARAAGIVQQVAQVSEEAARLALDASEGHVKSAVLIAGSDMSCETASALLTQTNGHLRPALARCTSS